MSERTPLMILEELAEKASSAYYCDGVLSSMRRDDVYKSEQVGKLVKGLSDEDREILSELSSDEVVKTFTVLWSRPRPEKPITRIRGPVTFSKSKPNE